MLTAKQVLPIQNKSTLIQKSEAIMAAPESDAVVNPLYHWKPVLGTNLLGFSMGRGLGAHEGLRY